MTKIVVKRNMFRYLLIVLCDELMMVLRQEYDHCESGFYTVTAVAF